MKRLRILFFILSFVFIFAITFSSCGDVPPATSHNWEKFAEHPYLELTRSELLEQFPEHLTTRYSDPIIFENEKKEVIVIEETFVHVIGNDKILTGFVYVFPQIDSEPTLKDFQDIKNNQANNEKLTCCDLIALFGMPDDISFPDETSSRSGYALIYYSSNGDKMTAWTDNMEASVSISIR